MAGFNPQVPQVNDPELETALNRSLSIVGPVGKLNLSDTVVPVVNLADVRTPTIIVALPAFIPAEQFGGGSLLAPLANVVFADTGQLPAGIYDVILTMGASGNANDSGFEITHRNSADSATVFSFEIPLTGGTGFSMTYATTLKSNERLRIFNKVNTAAGERWAASIFAQRRS